jgi:hypothetical protein
MRIPLLIFAVSTAAALQLEPLVDKVADSLAVHARAVVQSDPGLERIRQELAGVQMEMMNVMRQDGRGMAELRACEAELKYALRAEEIRRDDAARCSGRMPVSGPMAATRCARSGETPRS